MSKFEKVIRVLATLGLLIASWAVGINQVATMLENAHNVQIRSAEARCASFQVPHALVADGVAYCYMVYKGEEKMIQLETLEELLAPDPNNSGS